MNTTETVDNNQVGTDDDFQTQAFMAEALEEQLEDTADIEVSRAEEEEDREEQAFQLRDEGAC